MEDLDARLPVVREFFARLVESEGSLLSVSVLARGAFKVLPDDEVSPLASAVAAATGAVGCALAGRGVRASFADADGKGEGAQAVLDAVYETGHGAIPPSAYRLDRRYERTFIPILSALAESPPPAATQPVYWLISGDAEWARRCAGELRRSQATVIHDEVAPRDVQEAERLVAGILDRWGRLDGVVLTACEMTGTVLAVVNALRRSGILGPGLRLLLFSSLAALTGRGPLDRALDAGFIHGLAQHCRDRFGVDAVGVGWDEWADPAAGSSQGAAFTPSEVARLTADLLRGSAPWAQVAASPRPLEEAAPAAADAATAGSTSRPRPVLSSDYRAPRNDVERELIGIVEEFLGVSPVGLDDSYFELGATSLDLVQLRERLARRYPEISVVGLFDRPTVAALAAGLQQGGSPPGDRQAARLPSESATAAAIASRDRSLLGRIEDRLGGGAADLERRGTRFEAALVRGFYDAVNRRLNASPFAALSRFLNYGYVADGSPEHSRVELPARCLNRNAMKLVLEVIGDCPLRSEHAVLDVGCGRGGALSMLHEWFAIAHNTGIDLSPQAIEFCLRSGNGSQDRFLVADAENLPFEEGSFDRVLNIESSHHYEDLGAFYREVYRVLRPEGLFLYADMIPASRIDGCVASLRDLGFAVEHRRDITNNVVLSCDQTAAGNAEALAGEGNGELMAAFLAVRGSENYLALSRRAVRYVVLRLRKTSRSGVVEAAEYER
jgi:SAM-dependent methyltransferase